MRSILRYPAANLEEPEKKLLGASRYFRCFCLMDGNGSRQRKYSLIAAAGEVISTNEFAGTTFEKLDGITQVKDWLFGHITYDVKNEIEHLHSANPDGTGFPGIYFFQPQYVFIIEGDELLVHYHHSIEEAAAREMVSRIMSSAPVLNDNVEVNVKPRISREYYLEQVDKLMQHIKLGDIYEVNFCQEFYSENAAVDPVNVFSKLNSISHAPFSAYYKLDGRHLMCASPERFLLKEGSRIISQPIKGTARRGKDAGEDEQLKKELAESEKERSENVMIVDLVRNDLSRIATRGSVKVDELFGIYTFGQVHQMISTVSAELREDVKFTDVIKAAFPMGSMTGAPKVKAMQLIEQYESTRRGLYSGTLGYIDPEGNFDLNVVIRSIIYNAAAKYLSFMVGSAITVRSVPGSEYDECLVKAAAMLKALNGKVTA